MRTGQKRSQAEEKQGLRESYVKAFEQDGGAILDDLKKRFWVTDSMFREPQSGHFDALELARREGNREVVLYILEQIEKAYQFYGGATRGKTDNRK
jgi:hypothetical protein